ncbi:NTP pyrophosphohydrolase [Pantoea dispersa]|uniref:DUF6889 family protein n=1 Tax=Pantoea TaxID=53335 RepID=UPI001CCAB12E|nr:MULTISPECIES: NTP pyrophosphohydrolase [Pantoea]MCT6589177.1 NTP pyrophosphohydrolase [Pantoea dispersa]MEB5974942.1 NTP pyrophosphohydrolase [Pantoea dispersa]UBN56289.1 NTP pyrophosphohydrolase [Pantoea agglomerans]
MRRPVEAGYITYDKLLDGTVDLADVARMNDWLDIKEDNDARIRRWQQDNQ